MHVYQTDTCAHMGCRTPYGHKQNVWWRGRTSSQWLQTNSQASFPFTEQKLIHSEGVFPCKSSPNSTRLLCRARHKLYHGPTHHYPSRTPPCNNTRIDRHVDPAEDNNDPSRREGGRIQIDRKLVKKRKLTAGELVVARRGDPDGGRKWQAAKVIKAMGQGSYR